MSSVDRIIDEMIQQFLRITNKYNVLNEKPYEFGVNELLTPAEVHTIDAIGRNSGANVTELAHRLGVTKGALSQMANKLQLRNFIVKLKDKENEKEVFFKLTKKGKKAFDEHIKFHLDMHKDFARLLENTPGEQIYHFKEIFDKIEFYLDHYKK